MKNFPDYSLLHLMNDGQNSSFDKPLNIFTIGDAILRTKTKIVTSFDDNLKDFVNRMLKFMYDSEGIGLAAPQVGYSQKICVIDVSPCLSDDDSCTMDGAKISDISTIMPLFLINPIITHKSANMVEQVEGCLSIPEFSATVRRPEEVTVEFITPDGRQHVIVANAILSRCLQHEIDHLNGRLYTDLIGKKDKARLVKYLAKHSK